MKKILIQEYESINILGISSKEPTNNFYYSFSVIPITPYLKELSSPITPSPFLKDFI